MNLELVEKVEDFLDYLGKNRVIVEYKEVKEKILEDTKLLKEIANFQSLSKSSNDYINQKRELFENKNYKRFLELENEIYFWTLYMSDSLKKLTRGN